MGKECLGLHQHKLPVPNIYVSTYTGNDGGNAASWVGAQFVSLPFTPKLIIIFENDATPNISIWLSGMPTNYAHMIYNTGVVTTLGYIQYIVKGDVLGFYINDRGANGAPNTNGVIYTYIALG